MRESERKWEENRLDLAGEWQLCTDESPCRYEQPPALFQMTMQLPGTTAQQKIGTYNTARESGFFTEKFPFEGQIWLRRVVRLSEKQAEMPHCFLNLERTRITTLWVNGEKIGSENSLCTPHVYDLSGHLDRELELLICVRNTGYPTRGGHMTSPDTQTNWIGITGEMFLEFHEECYLSKIRIFPDAEHRKVTVKGFLHGDKSAEISAEFLTQKNSGPADLTEGEAGGELLLCDRRVINGNENGVFSVDFDLPEGAPLWSEHSPEEIILRMTLERPRKTQEFYERCFGLRDFRACGDHFEINGHRTMLRGKHDGMVFPMTGAAPTDIPSWEKVLRTVKEWGINHYRFHTCCPPEAAFYAADHVGIYMEPELPFWGTIDAPDGEKYDGEEQAYLIREGLRICERFGDHPSFCMMSLGNELWGNPEHIGRIIATLREADPRPLYTQGSNNFQFVPVELPQEDFWTGVRTGIGRLIRGSYADCDLPLGRIQTQAPSASWDYEEYLTPGGVHPQGDRNVPENGKKGPDDAAQTDAPDGEIEIQFGTGVKKVKAEKSEQLFFPSIPAVTHEIGQYNIYPDYREIEGYTGVLEARSFEIFRERLETAGMGEQAQAFFASSGYFSRDLYKMELEAAMRTPHLAGFQILDLQDFPGQGTALVGMLNSRLENKGFAAPESFRGFCGDLAPLAVFDSYVWTVGEKVPVRIAIRSSRPALRAQRMLLSYSCEGQEISGEFAIPENANGYLELGTFEISAERSGKAHLRLWIPEEEIENSWDITVFPVISKSEERLLGSDTVCDKEGRGQAEESTKETEDGSEVVIAHSIEEADPALQAGKRVLLLTGKLGEGKAVKGFYCTDFWNYHMFNSISVSMGRQVPVGTMGLCIDPAHPVAKSMYSESYTTPQWYTPVTHSDCAILDSMPVGYRPILQMIDNVDRNHRLGILYEAKMGKGSLLVCTVRFHEAPDDIAMKAFGRAVLSYISSDAFAPETECTWEQLGM